MIIKINRGKFLDIIEKYPELEELYLKEFWARYEKRRNNQKSYIIYLKKKDLFTGQINILIGKVELVEISFNEKELLENAFIKDLIKEAEFFEKRC